MRGVTNHTLGLHTARGKEMKGNRITYYYVDNTKEKLYFGCKYTVMYIILSPARHRKAPCNIENYAT